MKPIPPFTRVPAGFYLDAAGDYILCCSTDGECPELWTASFIDANPHFSCPKCGRIGIRMDEADKTKIEGFKP